MESLEYAQNGIRIPLTDGKDFMMVDADNPSLLISGPKESTLEKLVQTFKHSLTKNYDASSFKLIEFELTDNNLQPFVISCNKDLDTLANRLLTKGAYMTRDLDDFPGQLILLLDISSVTQESTSLSELVSRINQFTSKYGIYLIAINVGNDIHISTKEFSSISITRPNIDIAYKLFDNPFISTIVHPHHYFFKYMSKAGSTEGLTKGLVLTISEEALATVHS